jgi:CRP-like cAMP-binding protein
MKGQLPLFQIPQVNNVKNNEFFSTFFAERENDVVGCGPVQAYSARMEIFCEDNIAKVVYLIERGIVMLSRLEPDGRRRIVGIRGRYWLLAAPPVFLGIPYQFTGTTVTPCHLRPITAKCFLHLLKTNESFSWEMHRLFSQEILRNLQKVIVTSMSADDRLRHFLCRLITEMTPEESKIQNHFEVPLKHTELAEIVGVSPEHLSRVVKKMQQKGVLRSTKGMLTIMDASRLMSLSF